MTFAALELPYAFSFVFGGTPPPPPHPPVTLRVHRVQSNWSESTVTWANKPAYDPTPTATLGGITNFGVKEIEVTQLVRNWAHGVQTNFGFALTSPNDRALGFNSWESTVAAGQKPALYIEVGPGVAPKPIPAMPAVWSALLVLAIATLLSSRLGRAR